MRNSPVRAESSGRYNAFSVTGTGLFLIYFAIAIKNLYEEAL